MHHACAINTRKEAGSLTQNASDPPNILVITPHPYGSEAQEQIKSCTRILQRR